MLKMLQFIERSLTTKVVVAVSILILAGGGLLWYTSIQTEKKISMDDALVYISSFSELMKKSVRYDMLTNKREDIRKTLETLGNSAHIEKLQLLDTQNHIVFSSVQQEVGQVAGNVTALRHLSEKYLKTDISTMEERWAINKTVHDHRYLTYMDPIYNEPDCYTAACHAHSENDQILGYLRTDFSLKSIDARIKRGIINKSMYVIYFLLITIAVLAFILWRLVLQPVTNLSRGMKMVSSGDLLQKVKINSEDEIGRLARTFNLMTTELHAARRKMMRWNQSLEEEVEKKTKEIMKTRDKLIQAEKLAALGRLSADIAHEIRNPLTALGGFGRLLVKSSTTEKQKQHAQIVVSEASRLEKILRDILIFSRDKEFSFQKSTVTDLVKESVMFFDELCKEKAITIVMTMESDLAVLIEHDQARQAIDNLIANAIDAMPAGGVLDISSSNVEANFTRYAAITIADTGQGVAPDQLNRIFEPFFTTKKAGEGTGLGLAICRKIIEEHGGFITAENKPDKGLAVSLFFPFQSDDALSEKPCWTHMNCGRDVSGELRCPAFPHFGRVCWVVAGTLCSGTVQGAFAQKLQSCQLCDFFKNAQEQRKTVL